MKEHGAVWVFNAALVWTSVTPCRLPFLPFLLTLLSGSIAQNPKIPRTHPPKTHTHTHNPPPTKQNKQTNTQPPHKTKQNNKNRPRRMVNQRYAPARETSSMGPHSQSPNIIRKELCRDRNRFPNSSKSPRETETRPPFAQVTCKKKKKSSSDRFSLKPTAENHKTNLTKRKTQKRTAAGGVLSLWCVCFCCLKVGTAVSWYLLFFL